MSALRATLRREITLIRRTSFIYIFRTFQVGLRRRQAMLMVISLRTARPMENSSPIHPLWQVLPCVNVTANFVAEIIQHVFAATMPDHMTP